ncbi:hypothetical protein C4K24_3558 [Pseudomonas chlororaphis subsp. aurantiaca]|nr:hypothetical protein C4K24_3558 [Pseudomonas chlororaphis subsp. aurantiaca]
MHRGNFCLCSGLLRLAFLWHTGQSIDHCQSSRYNNLEVRPHRRGDGVLRSRGTVLLGDSLAIASPDEKGSKCCSEFENPLIHPLQWSCVDCRPTPIPTKGAAPLIRVRTEEKRFENATTGGAACTDPGMHRGNFCLCSGLLRLAFLWHTGQSIDHCQSSRYNNLEVRPHRRGDGVLRSRGWTPFWRMGMVRQVSMGIDRSCYQPYIKRQSRALRLWCAWSRHSHWAPFHRWLEHHLSTFYQDRISWEHPPFSQ